MGINQGQTIRVALALGFLMFCGSHIAAQPEADRRLYRLNMADKRWALDVSLRGFTVVFEESKKLSYTLWAGRAPSKDSRMNIFECRVYMSPSQTPGDALSVRSFQKNRTKSVYVKSLEHNGIPIIEYVRSSPSSVEHRSPPGLPTIKVMEAFWVHDQTLITVAVSVISSIKQDDRSFFHSLIDSVRFVDTSTPTNSFDHYQKGRALYLQNEYAGAIQIFANALELEGKKRELEYSQWVQLILDFADCFSAIRAVDSFKQLLDYAIAESPSEYRFHWALARYYAGMGDLSGVIESLRLAYKHQPARLKTKNPLPSILLIDPVSIANPLVDKAFERFHKVEEFRKAVKQMMQERH